MLSPPGGEEYFLPLLEYPRGFIKCSQPAIQWLLCPASICLIQKEFSVKSGPSENWVKLPFLHVILSCSPTTSFWEVKVIQGFVVSYCQRPPQGTLALLLSWQDNFVKEDDSTTKTKIKNIYGYTECLDRAYRLFKSVTGHCAHTSSRHALHRALLASEGKGQREATEVVKG